MTNPQIKVLRAKETAQYLGIAKPTLYRWIEQGKLPKGKKLGERVTVWEVAILDKFLAEKLGAENE